MYISKAHLSLHGSCKRPLPPICFWLCIRAAMLGQQRMAGFEPPVDLLDLAAANHTAMKLLSPSTGPAQLSTCCTQLCLNNIKSRGLRPHRR